MLRKEPPPAGVRVYRASKKKRMDVFTKQHYINQAYHIVECIAKGISHGLNEVIIDNFAGGGGASTGIEIATGYSVYAAINHDPAAIKLHKTNHPSTRHYCENVWDVNPLEVCNGNPVGLAWFSPDCKHFSKAKGRKPKDKNIRGLAWVALRWAGLVRPRVIMLENVEEFKDWGPLNRRHYPIKAKKGKTFHKFVEQFEALGYEVEFRELVAADYGAPTMRKRLFMIARCDGQPIVWPEPTHAPMNSKAVKDGILEPYVGAYTQIDFSRPCPSIFESEEEIKRKYGVRAQRPLADKTMQRIARGLQKFVLDNPEPFIIQANHGGERKPQDVREPMPTITGKHGFGFVEPYMIQIGQTGFAKDRSKDVREPLTTIVSKNEHCLIESKLERKRNSVEKRLEYLGFPDTEENRQMLRFFDIVNQTEEGKEDNFVGLPIKRDRYPAFCNAEEMDKLPFADPDTEKEIIASTLIQYHSETTKNSVRGQDLKKPIMTVDGSNRYGLVNAFVQSIPVVNNSATSAAHIVKMKGTNIGQNPEDPLQTITAGGLHYGNVSAKLEPVSASFVSQMQGKSIGKDVREPINTMTGINHMAEVRAFLIKYYGTGTVEDIMEPLDTVTARDRFGLVTIHGIDYQIVDIGLRMLEAKELYGCQGFPNDYIIDKDYTGKRYPRYEQVNKCGNSVSPPIPAALVQANLLELCTGERVPNLRIIQEQSGQLRFA